MAHSAIEKPTILLIPGAWHKPKYFRTVMKQLESQGYPTLCLHLPSCKPDGPLVTMYEDAHVIGKEFTRLVDAEGKRVVVAMHSYGGIPATEAVTEDLSYTKRKAAGKAGGVICFFYLTAFMVPPGVSLLNAVGNSYPPWIKLNTPSEGRCIVEPADFICYNDLPAEEQSRWVSELVPFSTAAFESPLRRASYLHVPTTYFLCEEDHAIPIQAQEGMVKAAEEAGLKIRTVRSNSAHSPMLSQPDMLVREIVSSAKMAAA